MENSPEVWNKEKLYELVKTSLGGRLFVVVSNREPYIHTMSSNEVIWHRPVSGLTEALDPVLRASGGTWVAYGAGDADKRVVDATDRVAVPPDNPEYTLRRVWLTQKDVAGYYLGFANGGLWPLCHVTFTPPDFKEADWHTYMKVNRVFAEAVLEEIADRPAVVLVQDYHFALLSGYLKEQNPDLTVGQFWHIPWPQYEILRTCPWHREILEGLLGNDLLGFHTRSFCDNFLETVERSLEAKIDPDNLKVVHGGRTTEVAPFPISVDYEEICRQASTAEVEKEMENLVREFNLAGKVLGVGMDRVDYTKGIPQRFQALDRFFEDNPEYRGKVVFIQAGMPSRTDIGAYRELGQKIDEIINEINLKYGTDAWQPVIALNRQLSHATLNALRRLARFCVVSSLHDGMNLVAKEYVAARADNDGVLVLSRFTGASLEMGEALLVNPYDIADFSLKIKEAVEMPEAERRRRIRNLRRVVSRNNIYGWGAAIVSRLISLAGE